jgi:hypothetical protein
MNKLPPILFFVTIAFLVTFLFAFRRPNAPLLVRVPNNTAGVAAYIPDKDKPSLESIDQRIGELTEQLRAGEATRQFLAEQIKQAAASGHAIGAEDGSHLMVATDLAAREKQMEAEENILRGQILALQDLNKHLEDQEHGKKEGAKKYEAYMPMVITGFLALVALGLLLFRYSDPHAQKWVFGTLGSILGYWLKGA